jgi:hypothetical protein
MPSPAGLFSHSTGHPVDGYQCRQSPQHRSNEPACHQKISTDNLRTGAGAPKKTF